MLYFLKLLFLTALKVSGDCILIKKIEDLFPFINQRNKTCFRVILRKDFNWYGWFSDDTHIEDIIEVAMWGIEIDSKEYFIQCFLKKEYMPELKKKFDLVEIK